MSVQLSDLRLGAQQRADRVSATTPTTAEWNGYVNYEASSLYRKLTALFEDYNVQTYSFTLPGGSPGNTLSVGFGTAVPTFDKLRGLKVQVAQGGANGPNWLPLKQVPLFEKDRFGPSFANYAWANVALRYCFYGATIEVVPPQSAAGSYILYFVPSFSKLVNDSDTIDGTWMATNGIDEFIMLGAAAQALRKEESLDSAAVLRQDQAAVYADIIKGMGQRDDNTPGTIVDTKYADGYGPGWGGGWP